MNTTLTREAALRLFISLGITAFTVLLLTACGQDAPVEREAPPPAIQAVGQIESKKLDETSGLAMSTQDSDLIWAINDDGPAALYAMDTKGNKRGVVRIRDAENIDWEDADAFEWQGQAYLLVADTGDNESRRPFVTLYIVEEPSPKDDRVDIAWRIDFRYPNGPHDTESVAVDPVNGEILVLTKRDVPAQLYSLPLRSDDDDVLMATPVTTMSTLPQPTPFDLANAAHAGWAWQPTAMSVSAGGALILTYEGVYFYQRPQGARWVDVFGIRPMGVSTDPYRDAESLTFGAGDDAYMTLEGQHPPLLHIDLSSAH